MANTDSFCPILGGTINSRMFYGKQIYIAVNSYSLQGIQRWEYLYDPCYTFYDFHKHSFSLDYYFLTYKNIVIISIYYSDFI